LLEGWQRQQGCLQGGTVGGCSGDANPNNDNQDDGNYYDPPLRLHEGRQCDQGGMQDRRSANSFRPIARRGEDLNQDDINHD